MQTNEEAQGFVHDLDLFVKVQILDDTPTVLPHRKHCEEPGYSYDWVSGQKTTVDQTKEENCMQNGKLLTSCCSKVVIQFWYQFVVNIDIAGLVVVRRDEPAPGNWSETDPKTQNLNKERNDDRDSDERLRDLHEWLEEFTDNQGVTEMPAPAHISQDSDFGTSTKVTSRIQNISTHFPKDRKCEVCLRTWIVRASWRRRTGEAVPRAEKFGDLITADHEVLNEEGESRNNHQYAVVVQDLATQRIQSYPCRTKTSQETEKSLQKFLEPTKKPKVIYTDISLEFGKSCEDSSWNHRSSTPHRSETNGIAERAVRRIKEGTSAVPLQSGLDEKWWADSVECCCSLRNVQDLLADGKTSCERGFGEPFKGPIIPFGSMIKYHPISAEDQSRLHQFGKKVLPGIFLACALIAEENLEIFWLQVLRNYKSWTHQKLSSKNQRKRRIDTTKGRRIQIHQSRWYSKSVREILQIPRTHSKAGTNRREWRCQRRTSRRIGRVSTDRNERWHRSPKRLLIHFRWLHLSSSSRTLSSTPCAARRNIHHSTEIHWCNQVHSYKSECGARKAYRWSLACRRE